MNEETKIIKWSKTAKHACVRFWFWRGVLIVICGVIIGQYISNKIAPHPVADMQRSIKDIEIHMDNTDKRINRIESNVDTLNTEINTIKNTLQNQNSRQEGGQNR